jgi:toxin ParE1/3/4
VARRSRSISRISKREGGSGSKQRVTVRLSPKARDDLDEIWFSIATDNPAAADRLLERIGAGLERLSVFPQLGVPRPEIATDARILVEGSYLVIYEATAKGVDVVRVLHGARDLRDLF